MMDYNGVIDSISTDSLESKTGELAVSKSKFIL